MNNAKYSYAAEAATRHVRTIYCKEIPEDLALTIIENYLQAYKERTRHSYTGEIEQGDLSKALNAAGMGNKELFTDPEAYKEFFYKKTRAEAEDTTFADFVCYLVGIAIADRFGIRR